jgi:hypothetical protein
MENCVFCNKDNLKEKIKYILDPINRQEIDRIRINGKLFIINKHSVDHRAKYINDIIYDLNYKKKIINQDYLDACYRLGDLYKDFCSSIFIIAKKK